MPNESLGFDGALSADKLKTDEDWLIRLGFLIHDCARLRRVLLDERYKPLGITRSQAWLLAYLSHSEGSPQTALAEQMALGNVAIGALIDRLEASGYLERRADPKDRRINRVYLTAEGKKIVRKMRQITLDANEDLFLGTTGDQIKTTVMVLETLAGNLKEVKGSKSRSGSK